MTAGTELLALGLGAAVIEQLIEYGVEKPADLVLLTVNDLAALNDGLKVVEGKRLVAVVEAVHRARAASGQIKDEL